MKITKTLLHNGHLITSESPTTSAKALKAECFEQTKSTVLKVLNVKARIRKKKKTIFNYLLPSSGVVKHSPLNSQVALTTDQLLLSYF